MVRQRGSSWNGTENDSLDSHTHRKWNVLKQIIFLYERNWEKNNDKYILR